MIMFVSQDAHTGRFGQTRCYPVEIEEAGGDDDGVRRTDNYFQEEFGMVLFWPSQKGASPENGRVGGEGTQAEFQFPQIPFRVGSHSRHSFCIHADGFSFKTNLIFCHS